MANTMATPPSIGALGALLEFVPFSAGGGGGACEKPVWAIAMKAIKRKDKKTGASDFFMIDCFVIG
jgi:hypothetical protein